MFEPERILNRLEADIAEVFVPDPTPCDRWIASSALQKAIRRGDVTRALPAAMTLWTADRYNFWRRLHITAMEDCSANADTVVTVLAATVASAWRKRIGDLKVGLYLTRLLCQSVKSRAADELLLTLERSGHHAALREQLAKESDRLLTERVINEAAPLTERGLAIWYLAGMRKFPSDLMPFRHGNPDAAKQALRLLNAPVELIEASITVMAKTLWPLSAFTTLIWQEFQRQGDLLQIVQGDIKSCPDVGGVPLYGLDMYTRPGKSCYQQLRQAVPELKRFSVRQIGIGVFYLEGASLDRYVTSPFLNKLRLAGELAEVEHVELTASDYITLRECLIENMDRLTEIRLEQLRRYLPTVARVEA